jgi:hypothetical protein
MSTEWKVIKDRLSAFEPIVRMQTGDGWTLHSWNIWSALVGGGRISPYPEEFVCSVWSRETLNGDPASSEWA